MSAAEVAPLLAIAGVGFCIIMLFLKADFLKNLIHARKQSSGFDDISYSNWQDEQNKIVNVKKYHYITIVASAVLLVLVLVYKVTLVFSGWYLIIWTGWIIGIIIKSALMIKSLFYFSNLSNQEKRNRVIYAQKSLIYLSIGLSFIPILLLTQNQVTEKYLWNTQVTIATSSFAIFGSAAFFFFVPSRISHYFSGGKNDMQIYIGFLLLMAAIGYFSSPPLEPIELTFLGKSLIVVPMFYIVVLQFGNVFGFAMMGALGKVLLEAIPTKVKR